MLWARWKVTSSCRPPKGPSQNVLGASLVLPCPALQVGLKAFIMWESLNYKLSPSSSSAPFPPIYLHRYKKLLQPSVGFSLAELWVEITMTADKSSIQMPYNATLSPKRHSRDFLIVSSPTKDTSWLGHSKTGILVEGGDSEQEQDFIQCSPF